MKVFISQPMRGKSKKQIMEERQKAIDYIESTLEDVTIIDSYFNTIDFSNPLSYLGESLKLLSNADIAFFIGEWRKARGCRIEHESCLEYGIRREYI